MNRMAKEVSRQTLSDRSELDLGAHEPRTISRREWFKASFGGSVGLAVGEFIDLPRIRAATQNLKADRLLENHAAAISRLTTEKRASRFSWKTGLQVSRC